jgi:hypothetical protein
MWFPLREGGFTSRNLDARAFNPYARRTFSRELEFRSVGILLLVLMGATLIASIGAQIAGFGGMPAAWLAK